jgi:hypothetical protein
MGKPRLQNARLRDGLEPRYDRGIVSIVPAAIRRRRMRLTRTFDVSGQT